MPLPNFLILGTAKSGTSTLARDLCDHPKVCFASAHEPNFFAFDRQRTRALAYDRTRVAHDDGEPRIGEKSWRDACTGHDPHGCDRVRRTLPELKLIDIVRDPIARGLSMWRELRDAGQDRVARDVATALTSDPLILDSLRTLARRVLKTSIAKRLLPDHVRSRSLSERSNASGRGFGLGHEQREKPDPPGLRLPGWHAIQ
jgi:hypothetical protein